ncbi:MAG: hypothetical protein K6F37_07925 [Lachnospiraceae bacterium]|nr:hypothetical protein [Lachnospiraceae bacterium]
MTSFFENNKNVPSLDSEHADKMLGYIFEEADVEPNTIPMSELEAYSNYRMEKFTLQRIILIIALAVFIALPMLFVLPQFTVTTKNDTVRGLPEYTINISTRLKVSSVTAVIGGESLPVYEVDSNKYTVEPIFNGTMTVTVELFNGQKAERQVGVSTVDSVAPQVLGSEIEGKNIKVFLKDKGIGVDYDNVYAIRNEERIEPAETNSREGFALFEGMQAGDVIYAKDYLENTLVIRVSSQ